MDADQYIDISILYIYFIMKVNYGITKAKPKIPTITKTPTTNTNISCVAEQTLYKLTKKISIFEGSKNKRVRIEDTIKKVESFPEEYIETVYQLGGLGY